MAGNKPDQEPSIEEILASIRQIISDDDETRPAGDIELPAEEKFEIPVHKPEVQQEKPRESFAEILELTNEIGDEDKVFDLSEKKFEIPLSEPEPKPEFKSREPDLDLSFNEEPARKSSLDLSAGQDDVDALFSAPAASATTEAFSRLLGNIPVDREENKRLYADGRITLEDIAKDLLRPMLRQWVDDHMPALVERLVEKELEKLARQARE
jgi:cell pole-organizing protein PopZ